MGMYYLFIFIVLNNNIFFLKLYRFITLEHEVSCLDVCSFKDQFDKTTNLVAVGLWMDISVKLFKLPDFVELVREPLGEGIKDLFIFIFLQIIVLFYFIL